MKRKMEKRAVGKLVPNEKQNPSIYHARGDARL